MGRCLDGGVLVVHFTDFSPGGGGGGGERGVIGKTMVCHKLLQYYLFEGKHSYH